MLISLFVFFCYSFFITGVLAKNSEGLRENYFFFPYSINHRNIFFNSRRNVLAHLSHSPKLSNGLGKLLSLFTLTTKPANPQTAPSMLQQQENPESYLQFGESSGRENLIARSAQGSAPLHPLHA